MVQPDLRKQESILQLLDSLQHLEAVATDVFNRISRRVGAQSGVGGGLAVHLTTFVLRVSWCRWVTIASS